MSHMGHGMLEEGLKEEEIEQVQSHLHNIDAMVTHFASSGGEMPDAATILQRAGVNTQDIRVYQKCEEYCRSSVQMQTGENTQEQKQREEEQKREFHEGMSAVLVSAGVFLAAIKTRAMALFGKSPENDETLAALESDPKLVEQLRQSVAGTRTKVTPDGSVSPTEYGMMPKPIFPPGVGEKAPEQDLDVIPGRRL